MVGSSWRHHGLRTQVSRDSAASATTGGGGAGGEAGEPVSRGGGMGGAAPVAPPQSSQRRLARSADPAAPASAARSAPPTPWQSATSAQMGDDGSVAVRFVNREATPCNLSIHVSPRTAVRPAAAQGGMGYARSVAADGRGMAAGYAWVIQLSASDIHAENTPARPGLVAPRSWLVRMPPTGGALTVPAFSYTVVEL